MFKRIRIAILLYVLLFVALGQVLDARRSTDWNNTLRVSVYPVNGGGSAEIQAYIDSLEPDAFAGVETFLSEQARSYGIPLERPFELRLQAQVDDTLPPIPPAGSMAATILWRVRSHIR